MNPPAAWTACQIREPEAHFVFQTFQMWNGTAKACCPFCLRKFRAYTEDGVIRTVVLHLNDCHAEVGRIGEA